jgi:hypothetical protein
MKYETIEGYPPYVEGKGYGNFGYPSAITHSAIVRDDADAVAKILEFGWITKESKTLDNLTMAEYCRKYSATKCATLFAQ